MAPGRRNWKDRIVSVDEAFSHMKSGQSIVAAMAAAEPKLFFRELCEIARRLENLRVYCANPSKSYECFQDESLSGRLELVTLFLTAVVRKDLGHGVVHHLPEHLSRWSKTICASGVIDIFWGTCTPPDEHGFVNLGVGACYEPEVLRRAKQVILEINPQMPRTFGSTFVSVDEVECFLTLDEPLPVYAKVEPGPEDRRIAELIAELVPDESTIQLGIGGIPNAVANALESKRDLGVHSELINDAMMELYQKGVITGAAKNMWPGKMIGAFVYGSSSLYRFVHDNPAIELLPASITNDPHVVGQNRGMISINTAIEVDLTGQVCAESVGHREISGIGGAADTHLGAQLSVGGKGLIALHSMTGDGKGSKVVSELKPGAKVTVGRNDVDTVVTEWGVARLHGKTSAERARAMIAIAHPSVRDELHFAARQYGYI